MLDPAMLDNPKLSLEQPPSNHKKVTIKNLNKTKNEDKNFDKSNE